MIIVSYDVATISLALSVIEFNDNWELELQILQKEFHKSIKKCKLSYDACECAINYLDKLDKLICNLIKPLYFDVVNLVPGQKVKDTTVIIRAARLKAYLNFIDTKLENLYQKQNSENIKILLEYQMGPNDKSRNVCSQILYHYSKSDFNYENICKIQDNNLQDNNTLKYDIEIIGPSLKNKINLNNNKPYSYYTKKYTKLYDANKAHSKDNFLRWVNEKKIEYMIKDIKKKNLDDIADSVNMTLAWVLLKSKLM